MGSWGKREEPNSSSQFEVQEGVLGRRAPNYWLLYSSGTCECKEEHKTLLQSPLGRRAGGNGIFDLCNVGNNGCSFRDLDFKLVSLSYVLVGDV